MTPRHLGAGTDLSPSEFQSPDPIRRPHPRWPSYQPIGMSSPVARRSGSSPTSESLVRSRDLALMNTNRDAVINAVTIIARHQVRVKTWLEAATLYNGLYHEGKIFRVHG